MRARNDDHDFSSFEDGLYAHGQCHFGYFVEVIVEESRIGDDGVVRERLDSCAGFQTRARLVECDVAIWTDAAQKKLNAAGALDLLFVRDAFGFEIWRISVQDVDVCWVDVNMAEKMLVHEAVV